MALGSNLSKSQTSIKKPISKQGKKGQSKFSNKENVFSEILENQKISQSEVLEENDPISLYVSFNVEQENYALPISLIDEVVPITDIAAIPQVPKFIRGMVNVRGEVYAVIDLGLKYELREIEGAFEPK